MAQAMAAAAAHSMPPFPLPALPRVRPPPIPKGTPGPNTLPMPPTSPPRDRQGRQCVWADGKWVSPSFKSAKHKQLVLSRQLEKALQHEVRGMNIYAYKHVRTNQVVYSLTKNMENNKILKQLLFHGKQTVPRALRRDLWQPYFSVHFPQTQDGATKGLKVFKDLRELSMRRQLSPPKSLTITTEQDLLNFKNKLGSRFDKVTNNASTRRGAQYHRVDVPVPGTRIPQKLLAKRLMNQRATSVADVAAVLARLGSFGGGMTPSGRGEELAALEAKRERALAALNDRGVRRLQAIRKQELEKELEINARKMYLQSTPGQVKLDRHLRDRLSIEYEGSLNSAQQRLPTLALLEGSTKTRQAELDLHQTLARIDAQKMEIQDEIESTHAARIDQEIEAMSPEDRDRVQKDIQNQRQEAQEIIDSQIQQMKEMLKEYRDEVRAYIARHGPNNDMSQHIRILMREELEYLANRRAALVKRNVEWRGPYAEITLLVDQAFSKIDKDNEQILQKLRQEFESEKQASSDMNAAEIKIRWANQLDGAYANTWPSTVSHEDLAPKAVVTSKTLLTRQHAYLDENEDFVDEQKIMAEVQLSNSVHVFGTAYDAGRYQSPDQLADVTSRDRSQRIKEHTQTIQIKARDDIVALQTLHDRFAADLDLVDPELKERVLSDFAGAKDTIVNLREEVDMSFHAWIMSLVDYHETQQISSVLKNKKDTMLRDNDKSISDQADVLAYLFVDVNNHLIKLQANNLKAADAAEERGQLKRLFDDRARYVSRYPAADAWLSSEGAQQNSPPEGVQQIQDFDRQYPLIAPAVKRTQAAVNQAGYERDLDKANSSLYRKIVQIAQTTKQLERASTDSSKKSVRDQLAQLQDQYQGLKQKRLHLIQTSDAIFDKQAWDVFRQQLAPTSTVVRNSSPREKVKPKTPEQPTGLLGRLAAMFGR